jgi:E3 ubiquitin-protein ligase DOA10
MLSRAVLPFQALFSNRDPVADKSLDSKTTTSKEATPQVALADSSRQAETEDENSDTKTSLAVPKDDLSDTRVLENANAVEKALPTISTTVSTKGRSSKTSTPVVSTFSESQSRARASRNNDPAPAKRSHKKSGSVSTATYKPRVVATEDEESSREGDDEDDEGEPRYCYCNEVSFGEMVACDNDACAREWFHLSCVGLTKPPGKNGMFHGSIWPRDRR